MEKNIKSKLYLLRTTQGHVGGKINENKILNKLLI